MLDKYLEDSNLFLYESVVSAVINEVKPLLNSKMPLHSLTRLIYNKVSKFDTLTKEQVGNIMFMLGCICMNDFLEVDNNEQNKEELI